MAMDAVGCPVSPLSESGKRMFALNRKVLVRFHLTPATANPVLGARRYRQKPRRRDVGNQRMRRRRISNPRQLTHPSSENLPDHIDTR